MAVFIMFEKIKNELEDTWRGHRRLEREPNEQYNYQNEKISGQVLQQFEHSKRKLINWKVDQKKLPGMSHKETIG